MTYLFPSLCLLFVLKLKAKLSLCKPLKAYGMLEGMAPLIFKVSTLNPVEESPLPIE
jgi:hypothetical protein